MNKSFPFLTLLIIFSAWYGIAQESRANDISSFARKPLKQITKRDGLPQGTIMCIATDSSGRLWVGTQDGAAYYDQSRWTVVNMPNRTISNWVQSMFVASDGSLWFGTVAGTVHHWALGKWESFDMSNGLAGRTVWRICETTEANGERAVWFATDGGLSEFVGGKWKTYTQQNGLVGNIAYDVYRSRDGSLWVGTDRGASRRSHGVWRTVDVPDGMKGKTVAPILESTDGAMWFGGRNVVGRYENGKWTVLSVERGRTPNAVRAMYQRSNGEVWIGTGNGVWKHSGTERSVSSASALEFVYLGIEPTKKVGVSIVSIHETIDGSLWFGTFMGLYRYNDGEWQSIVEKMGPLEGGATAICETSNGGFWFGTQRTGLVRYQNGSWSPQVPATGYIVYLYESKERSLWVSLYHNGVVRYEGQTLTTFSRADGLASDNVWFIYQTRDSALWFGGDNGASKYALGKWEVLTTANGLPDNTALSMCETKDGSLWFGTRGGVTRYHSGTYQTFGAKEGFGGNAVVCILDNSTLTSDASGSNTLWFGTQGSGASRLDLSTNTWRTFNDTTSPRLSNNVVYSIERDGRGRLYFLTNSGVTRFTFLHDGEIRSEEFTTEDGLPSDEGNMGASFVDSRGRIWVGTTEGAAFLDPTKEVVDTVRKPLFIRDAFVADLSTSLPLERGAVLRYDQNDIIFHYTLVSYYRESAIRYQVQLVGYDPEPLNWMQDYKKEYTNLPDGEYVFRVWGRDYAGNASGPAEFPFVIRPPYWKTWWFRSFLSLVIVGTIFITARIYVARKLKKQLALLERQQMIERERTRISQDMHDTVGSSLTRIAILSDRAAQEAQHQQTAAEEPSALQSELNLIGETAREVIDTMNEIIWSLSQKHDSLESLVAYIRHFAKSMFETTSIEYKFTPPDTIPDISLGPDFRRNTFLIVKEAINNIVKHSGTLSVSLAVRLSDETFEFELCDNGVGFREPSPEDVNGMAYGLVEGFGLKNMRARAKAIGATLEIESFPQRGTKVQFRAPLRPISTVAS